MNLTKRNLSVQLTKLNLSATNDVKTEQAALQVGAAY
jgi:hypothetical protein